MDGSALIANSLHRSTFRFYAAELEAEAAEAEQVAASATLQTVMRRRAAAQVRAAQRVVDRRLDEAELVAEEATLQAVMLRRAADAARAAQHLVDRRLDEAVREDVRAMRAERGD